jgi:hypothetical protein
MDLRDISYYVKRKQGRARLTDQGIMDIFLGGSGFSFRMKLSNAQRTDRQNFFKVDSVDVDVKNFKIKLKQSKFRTLFRMVKPVMLKLLRPVLQKVLEKQIKDQFNKLDALAYDIKKEADRAKHEVSSSIATGPNLILTIDADTGKPRGCTQHLPAIRNCGPEEVDARQEED